MRIDSRATSLSWSPSEGNHEGAEGSIQISIGHADAAYRPTVTPSRTDPHVLRSPLRRREDGSGASTPVGSLSAGS
jgi:hypothetical protein